MIRYKVTSNARILFVGINPHHGSYRRGVPFSNNKMLWYLLARAGILEEQERDLKDDSALKHLYEGKFSTRYRLSFLNLIDRPTCDITELKQGEEARGVLRLRKAIRRFRPRVVCFIGKVTFNRFRGSRDCAYGWQEDLHHSRVYVAHFPLRGLASVRIREFQEVKRVADRVGPNTEPTAAG